MTEHEPEAMDAPRASSKQTRPPRRMRMTIIAAVALLVTLISGSLFAAQSITSRAPLAPEVSLSSATHGGSPARSQGTTDITSVNAAACHCTPKRATFVAPPFVPSGAGQVVIVSLTKQQLWAYQNGQLVMTSLVTTGMPQLPTPQGTFHIMMKEQNVWFYSPWPVGSPYYYTPEHINYAMLFRSGGFYIHDAPWRETFGPGTEYPHTEPDGKPATGSHGCVNMPTSTAGQLYAWIGIGATVIIQQ